MMILFVLAMSCSDHDETLTLEDGEYLVFGHFYGQCVGEGCIEIFKVEKDRLSEDTIDNYPNASDFYIGSFSGLDEEMFKSVKDVIAFFPTKLLNEENVIGMPDAGDWGGLYIEYNMNGTRKFWLLDQMKENVPQYLHPFIDKINEKITYLNTTGRCYLEPDSGDCEAAIPRYYFDKEEQKCKEFIWGGCGGVVPFETLEDCRDCENP